MEKAPFGKKVEPYVPPTDEARQRSAVEALYDSLITGTGLPPEASGYLSKHPDVAKAALDELVDRYPDQPAIAHYAAATRARLNL